ncbi:O-antigen ligase family protein [Salinibacter ruber]|uniref:O-antigen ligase family protein n=1 Tax=Salinibacter ruber TaxID=146919 RepID=UPI00216938A9|nr:O-antigen ligase family protein [Salinibacter ruber]
MYAFIYCTGVTYAWILGEFGNSQMTIGLFGSIFVTFSTFLIYTDTSKLKTWLWLFAVMIAVSNILLTVLIVVYPPSRSVIFEVTAEGVRLRGMFENPNMFGGAQILAISIFSFFVANRERGKSVLGAIGLIITFLALLATQSRSAILGLVIGATLVSLFILRVSRRRLVTSMSAALVVVVMVAAYVNLPKSVAGVKLSRVGEASETSVYDVGIESAIQSRFYIYDAAFNTIAARPFGIGYVDKPGQVVAMHSNEGVEKMPHNFILAYFIRYGLLVGGVMVVFWLVPMVLIVKKLWGRTLPVRSLASLMLVGLTGYLIHNLFHSMTNWVYFWVFWAMSIRAAQLGDVARGNTER